jgi:flagellar basal-body rod protein FlgB
MIEGMFEVGSMPALERMVQFTSQRHKHIAHNIANLSTPNFVPRDLDPASFQKSLGEAIDRRREGRGVYNAPLEPRDTASIRFHEDGLSAEAENPGRNILFHDRNNRSLEHQMQSLAENAMAHNAGMEMLRNQFDMLQSTIREQA